MVYNGYSKIWEVNKVQYGVFKKVEYEHSNCRRPFTIATFEIYDWKFAGYVILIRLFQFFLTLVFLNSLSFVFSQLLAYSRKPETDLDRLGNLETYEYHYSPLKPC